MDGSSTAVKRVIGIFIYYVILFFIVSMAIGVNTTTIGDNSISGEYGGIDYIEQVRERGGECGLPQIDNPFSSNSCSLMTTLRLNETCSLVNGCEWTENVFGTQFYCKGSVNLSYYNGGTDEGIKNVCETSFVDLLKTNCDFFGCTWTTFADLEKNGELGEQNSRSTFTDSLKFVTGFKVDLGGNVNPSLRFVISLFFYIPLIILIISLYSLIPFI